MDDSLFDSDSLEIEMPNSTLNEVVAKIAVIGVGGAGCNMIDHMITEGCSKVNLIVANTDLQVLNLSKAPKKIQLGPKLTRGRGAGADPEIGKNSALESYEFIKESLIGSDIVFISAGLGGGTGTGAASIVAAAVKEIGALSIAVVTKPFSWEGARVGLANIGLEELRKVSDSVIVVSNDKLLGVVDKDATWEDSFKIVDNILYQAVNGMSEVILKSGSRKDFNTDIADIKTIMSYRGMALIGIGKAKGENAAFNALENAINSPLLEKIALNGAQGILIHFTISPKFSILAVNDIMQTVKQTINSNPNIIFGSTLDKNMESDETKITIVATGFKEKENSKVSMDSKDEVTKVKDNNAFTSDEAYLDIPPLNRNYIIKYQLD